MENFARQFLQLLPDRGSVFYESLLCLPRLDSSAVLLLASSCVLVVLRLRNSSAEWPVSCRLFHSRSGLSCSNKAIMFFNCYSRTALIRIYSCNSASRSSLPWLKPWTSRCVFSSLSKSIDCLLTRPCMIRRSWVISRSCCAFCSS